MTREAVVLRPEEVDAVPTEITLTPANRDLMSRNARVDLVVEARLSTVNNAATRDGVTLIIRLPVHEVLYGIISFAEYRLWAQVPSQARRQEISTHSALVGDQVLK